MVFHFERLFFIDFPSIKRKDGASRCVTTQRIVADKDII